MSVFLDRLIDSYPPKRFFTAAVAMAVLGHKAFTATPCYLNSSAMPKTHIDIPYFAMVYDK
jgi:hypothetical protein